MSLAAAGFIKTHDLQPSHHELSVTREMDRHAQRLVVASSLSGPSGPFGASGRSSGINRDACGRILQFAGLTNHEIHKEHHARAFRPTLAVVADTKAVIANLAWMCEYRGRTVVYHKSRWPLREFITLQQLLLHNQPSIDDQLATHVFAHKLDEWVVWYFHDSFRVTNRRGIIRRLYHCRSYVDQSRRRRVPHVNRPFEAPF